MDPSQRDVCSCEDLVGVLRSPAVGGVVHDEMETLPGRVQVANVESATRSERTVKSSSRTRTAFNASSGVWIRFPAFIGTPAFIGARVCFVVRLCVVIRSSLVIRPGLGFATAASFGLPGPAAPLTLAALLTAAGCLSTSAGLRAV